MKMGELSELSKFESVNCLNLQGLIRIRSILQELMINIRVLFSMQFNRIARDFGETFKHFGGKKAS